MLETRREGGTLGGHFVGSRLRLGVSKRSPEGFGCQFKEPHPGHTLGPRYCPQRGRRLLPGIRGVLPPSRLARQECEGSAFSRAAAAVPGSSGAGPSRAAKLTGSVCPTGRAALAKNSVLLSATCARREPGPRLWECAPRQSREPGSPARPHPRPGPGPSPRPSERCVHRCRGGWKARGPRSGRGRQGWERAARPPAHSPGPPCPSWGLQPACSARTSFTAQVRPGQGRACPSPFPAARGAWLSFPTAGPGAGVGGEKPGPHRAQATEPGALRKLTFSLKTSVSPPLGRRSVRLPSASVFLSGRWNSNTVKL